MSYIGNQPVLQSTNFREEFLPTSNQTAFISGGFHPQAISVYRNGVLLTQNGDYTLGADNVTVTLNSAAVNGDVVVLEGQRQLTQGVSTSESRIEHTWQSGNTYVQLNDAVIPAFTDVFLNGVKLVVADYSINASTRRVSFTNTPAIGDVIAVVQKNETSSLVALPLKDSAGNNILSESSGVVSLENTTLSNTVLGLPTIPTQVFAYGMGINGYDGTKVKYGSKRVSSGITFGPSDNGDATNFIPPSTGYYHINVNVNFWNEPPQNTEDDSGDFRLNWQDSPIEYLRFQFYVPSSPTNSHEGKGLSISTIYQVTSVGGATDYFNFTYNSFSVGNYNETYRVTIFKLS